nr:hypothetical protein CFP56_36041 [Quercus suber]
MLAMYRSTQTFFVIFLLGCRYGLLVTAHCLVHNGYKVCAYLAKLQLRIYILLECGLKCQAWDLNGLGGLAFPMQPNIRLGYCFVSSQFVKQRDLDITSP